MWILGVIFLIVAIALLDGIRKPPSEKKGEKPMTKKQCIISATVCGILSLLFFSMSGAHAIWRIIIVVSFFGVLIFAGMAVVSLFKKNKTAKKKFIYAGACFVVLIISAVTSSPSEPLQNTDTTKTVSASAEEDNKRKEAETLATKNAAEEKAKEEAKAKAEQQAQIEVQKPKDLQSQITDIINKKIGEKAGDKPRIISLEVNDNLGTKKEGDKIVLIKLNAKDNLTSNMIKKSIWIDTKKLLEQISKIQEVEECVFFWHFPLVDQHGNEKDEMIMKIGFTQPTLNKINWDNFVHNNIPNVADQYWQHPAVPK